MQSASVNIKRLTLELGQSYTVVIPNPGFAEIKTAQVAMILLLSFRM